MTNDMVLYCLWYMVLNRPTNDEPMLVMKRAPYILIILLTHLVAGK